MGEGSNGAMGDEAAAQLLHVDGLAEPAARLRLTPEGVELTFLAERRAGFLAWLAAGAAGHVYKLMREYERMADVDEAFAERLAAMPDGDEDEGTASDPGPEPAARPPHGEG